MKQLVWTSAARVDLDAIADYHLDQKAGAGDLVIGRIEEAATKLARFDTGRPGRIVGTREKSVSETSHIIVYEVHDDMLFVFRVMHTARNWP